MSNRKASAAMARVPVADPLADHRHLRAAIMEAVARVIDGGRYILGPEVAAFESRMAARLGVAGAVGVGCGTDALAIALRAAGVGDGDEVITVSHTAGPTVAGILAAGAVPVLVDIEPDSFCLDPATLEVAWSARTRAIVPVHLYGQPADLDAVRVFAVAKDVAVIEDCAQAIDAAIDTGGGARPVGSIGDFGCFSFYPTKNLGAVGDAGLICAARAESVARVRHMRTCGWTKPQYAEIAGGICSRLDELQAAILNVKLDHLAVDIERRRDIARTYNAAFADLPIRCPVERPGTRHVYHLYVIASRERDALARSLDEAGIATARHYPYPVHVQPAFASRCRIPAALGATETAGREILSLPLYPSMPAESRGRVIAAVRRFYGRS
jgi:dTDP-4-amino-4,6-dideoxygalactose transaminase